MADTGYTSYADQGTGAHLLQDAKDTPLVSDGVSVVQDAAKGDIAGVAGDVVSFATDAGTVLSDPLNALISAGLSFLMDVISPLRDLLEKVTGDPDALDAAKESFTDIAGDVAKLASELDDITRTGFQNWQGDAKNAATQKVQQFVQGVQGTANNASDVAQLLGISGTLMEAAYNLVMSIIADCVEWLIVTWVAALAASVFTFGASDAAATAATAAEVGAETANASEKVEQATSLVERITQILQKIMSELKKIKDAEKDLREGKNITKAARDFNKEAEEAKEAKAAAKAAKGVDKDKSLLDKAKDFGKDKLQDYKEEHYTLPKENLGNLTNNPKGVLQNLAKGRDDHLTHGIQDTLKDTGKDVLKDGFKTISGDLFDQVAPGDDSTKQARDDGPQGVLPGSNRRITDDLRG